MQMLSAVVVLAVFCTGESASSTSALLASSTSAPFLATVPTTTKVWDSSASSGLGTDSLKSSASSLGSSLLVDSSVSGSSYTLSGSESTKSGSSGSFYEIWQWIMGALLLCCCLGALGAMCAMGKKKAPKKKTTKKTKAATPVAPAPVPEQQPIVTEPLLAPLSTTSFPPMSLSTSMPIATTSMPIATTSAYSQVAPQYMMSGSYAMPMAAPTYSPAMMSPGMSPYTVANPYSAVAYPGAYSGAVV